MAPDLRELAAAAAARGAYLAGVGVAVLLTASFLPVAESSCVRGAPSPCRAFCH
jgi:hypothetical protein